MLKYLSFFLTDERSSLDGWKDISPSYQSNQNVVLMIMTFFMSLLIMSIFMIATCLSKDLWDYESVIVSVNAI